MNAIKKIVMFLVFILIQNKVNAQTQNNASVQDATMNNSTPVNINSDLNHKSFTKVSSEMTTNTQTFLPPNNIKNNADPQNSSNLDLILPQVIDSKSMDTKPE